ncbi:hypothetical protein AMQ84_00150 [Paenibacillus riograndensis]|uniref:Uncharacterized protein n=1 Tax=Paenibacillus riograndensis TaxID=483937 RepID=A0A132UCY5_9BACL|nr:hypothetical protein AMQ84_00150 [Paenibacillus riograndensis]
MISAARWPASSWPAAASATRSAEATRTTPSAPRGALGVVRVASALRVADAAAGQLLAGQRAAEITGIHLSEEPQALYLIGASTSVASLVSLA